MRGKKGNVFDVIFISVIVFAFGIASIIGIAAIQDIGDELLSDNETFTFNESYYAANETVTHVNSWIDNSALIVIVGLIIFILISAYFIDTHPAFFIVFLIMFGGVGFAWVVMEEVGDEIIGSETDWISVAASMPNTAFILDNFTKTFVTLFFLVGIVLFSKGQMTQSAGGGAL